MKVSVMMITYNHESYISQAIEGVLMQETDFPYELVIGEDCSTDGTRPIVIDYASRYPDKIRLLLSEKNLGAHGNARRTREACRGEYIALCEGDDYWTDPLKLQKQVDFLDVHREYVLCHHDAVVIDEYGKQIKNSELPDNFKRDYSSDELIKGSGILPLTACFRNVVKEVPPEIYNVINADIFFFSFLGNYGKAKYLGDKINPAAYRIHPGGIWSSLTDEWQRAFRKIIAFYWLKVYYQRIGKIEISRFFTNILPFAHLLYQLRSVEELEFSVHEHLKLLNYALLGLKKPPEEIALMFDCFSANIYVGAALAFYSLSYWDSGLSYMKRAIELDPMVWRACPSFYDTLITQGISIAEISEGIDIILLNNYIEGICYYLPREIKVSKSDLRRVQGRLYAEVAYRYYLADEIKKNRYFTWRALQVDPIQISDIGMIKRAVMG